jgi:hypothetical protein
MRCAASAAGIPIGSPTVRAIASRAASTSSVRRPSRNPVGEEVAEQDERVGGGRVAPAEAVAGRAGSGAHRVGSERDLPVGDPGDRAAAEGDRAQQRQVGAHRDAEEVALLASTTRPPSTADTLAVVPPTSMAMTFASPAAVAWWAHACVPNNGPDSMVSNAVVLPIRATPPLMWPTRTLPRQECCCLSVSSAR